MPRAHCGLRAIRGRSVRSKSVCADMPRILTFASVNTSRWCIKQCPHAYMSILYLIVYVATCAVWIAIISTLLVCNERAKQAAQAADAQAEVIPVAEVVSAAEVIPAPLKPSTAVPATASPVETNPPPV